MKILYLPNQHSQQRQFEKERWIYPIRLAMEATWHKQQGDYVQWGASGWYPAEEEEEQFDKVITKPEGLPFLSLPHADRKLTDAWNPKYQANGNFKYHPGTYIMSASGCWHGKCSFCVEQGQPYEVRPAADVWQEIEECEEQGFQEIFDDSATFPTGDWLEEFLDTVPYGNHILGCNMRMVDVDYAWMKQVGFRMLLFGVESANQATLDRINKGVKVEDWKYIKKAAEAGLEPHIACMVGYPWETDNDALNTIKLVHHLLRKGWAKTAQCSFYQVPGERSNEAHRKYLSKIYDVKWYPDFWFNQLKDIRNTDDLKYLWRKIKVGLSHN